MGTQENVTQIRTHLGTTMPSPQGESASMLFVYSRHAPDCAHKDELKYRRCRCPNWIDGYVDGKEVRQSAKTRSWEQAERKSTFVGRSLRSSEASSTDHNNHRRCRTFFMADEQGRSLSKETTNQSKTLFEKQLLPWAKAPRPKSLARSNIGAELVNFRAHGRNNGLRPNRKLSRLVGSCVCIQKWVAPRRTPR